LDAAAVLLLAIFIYFLGVYVWLLYLKYRQRILWDGLYAQLKNRFALLAELAYAVRDIYTAEPDALRSVTASIGAFISSKTPSDAAAAYIRANAAINSVNEALIKYPHVRDAGGCAEILEEMLRVDEKIAFASRFYDESVLKFNARVKSAPFALVARMVGIKAKGGVKLGGE